MSEWKEISNGNFVYPLDEGVMTVFKRKDGYWGGVHDGKFLKGKFDDPDEAQERMERLVFEHEESLAQSIEKGWKETKSGGYCRISSGVIVSVKKTSSGSWYILSSRDGIVNDQWFKSPFEAMNKADQIFNL